MGRVYGPAGRSGLSKIHQGCSSVESIQIPPGTADIMDSISIHRD